jgi:large-conductance mechanosensitive channel
MVGKWIKVIAAIVIVSILVFILYFAYDGNQCQAARERYEQSVGENVAENTRLLTEYQQACHIK